MATIGFIGLGRMGRPMAANLLRKGFTLRVLDLDSAAMSQLAALGARVAHEAAGIARECDIVITMLPTSVEVEAVAIGADGLFAHGREGAILMGMSTIDPLATDRLHALARSGRIALLVGNDPGELAFVTVKVGTEPAPMALPSRDGPYLRSRFREHLLGAAAHE